MYTVICYSEHEHCVIQVKYFATKEETLQHIKEDAVQTFHEDVLLPEYDLVYCKFELRGAYATLEVPEEEKKWVWNIMEIEEKNT